MENWDEGGRRLLCGRVFGDRVDLLNHLGVTADERHAQLWAILASKRRPRDLNKTRKELLKKLIVG